MPALVEALSDWLSRAELVARGQEGRFRSAKRALAEGNAPEALHLARALRNVLPHSPLVLALHADAATEMHLRDEALDAARELSEVLPYRGDIWLSRANLETQSGLDPRQSLVQAVECGDPAAAADAARLQLSDMDLATGDGERAERWLDQLSVARAVGPEVTLRRVRARLAVGDRSTARNLAKDLGLPATGDGPGWLLRAQLLDPDDPEADQALRRAVLLDAPGADELAQRRLPHQNAASQGKWRELARDLDRDTKPGWQLAFALSADDDDASEQLLQLAESTSDPQTLSGLAAAAVAARDPRGLRAVASASERLGVELDSETTVLADALSRDGAARLDSLAGLDTAWAAELRQAVVAEWFAREGRAVWGEALPCCADLAEDLAALEVTRALAAIGRELEGPLRVAVVGEFNAGKSSFVNALLGESVAATGVLPTTATLHRLVWSPDRIARIERLDGEPARVVAFSDLKATLGQIPADAVGEVLLRAPLELLKRVELVDTPGFNAPDGHHARAARKALDEAHVALWLLDASQALKASERERLEDIAASGVPIVVLLNKADRLSQAELEEALAHVDAGLRDAKLPTEGAALALSALLASPDSEDSDAYARSGFEQVSARLEELLGLRGRELKDRVLRVRYRRAVAALVAVAERRQRDILEAMQLRRAQDNALQAMAQQAALAPRPWVMALTRRVEERLVELKEIARPVQGAPVDAAADRFLGSRARRLLCDVIVEELLSLAQAADIADGPRAELRAGVGAALRALGPELAGDDGARTASRLATVCVDVVGELGRGRDAPDLQRPEWVLRLQALTAVMGVAKTPGASE